MAWMAESPQRTASPASLFTALLQAELRRYWWLQPAVLGAGLAVWALLAAAGARPWRVDHRSPRAGTVADIVADALAPPLVPGSIRFLVAANLLRQLWPLAGGLAVRSVSLSGSRSPGSLLTVTVTARPTRVPVVGLAVTRLELSERLVVRVEG